MIRKLLTFGCALCLCCLAHAYGVMVEDHGIKIYEHIAVLPGGAPTHSIDVNGKSYRDLSSPFYLVIPEKGLVCFLTRTLVGGRHLYVVPHSGTGTVFKIKLPKEMDVFGSSLSDKTPGPGSIGIILIKGDRVFLAEKNASGSTSDYCLDLEKKTLISVAPDMIPTK